jgi:DNA ligase-1
MRALLPPPIIIGRRHVHDEDGARAALEAALAGGHEGLVAKSLESSYEAGNRGAGWLKIKPAHTLDLVVLAAEWGHGRRRGWLSNLHLGARNDDGSFTMLGKTFKGMTDEMLAWQTAALQRIAVSADAFTVQVEPLLVVEVAFNDVQASPHYPGGLALRFARIKRYRDDKPAAEADTLDSVRAIHERGTRRPHDA